MIHLSRYLNQAIQLNTRTAYTKYGKSTTTASTIDARVVYTNSQDRGLQAKPLDYDVQVWVYPDVAVAVDDTITADGFTFRVVDVQLFKTRTGQVHHKKLLCQKYV